MRKIKSIISWFSTICLTIILIYCVGMNFWPEEISKVAGYRFYSILTDSMEPTIPTDSLVLTRLIKEDEVLKPNTIITFQANRFGQDIVLTHYFRETSKNDKGVTLYRTQAEGVDNFDAYETRKEDIIGSYVTHVPFLGKVFLYLQSTWGIITLCMTILIFIINRLISVRLHKAEESGNEVIFKKHSKMSYKKGNQAQEGIIIQSGDMIVEEKTMLLCGTISNHTKHSLYFVKVKIQFQNKEDKVVDTKLWYMVGREGLTVEEEKSWTCTVQRRDDIVKCKFEIESAKQV